LLVQAGVARADAIDGDWCAADGQQMSIQGSTIVTPGGNKLQGNYTRHAFDYVVPTGERGSGEAVNILLRGEYLAVSRQGSSDAPLKEWRRCKATTS
jgi:ABC-type phosphate transport system substrate-binding protein